MLSSLWNLIWWCIYHLPWLAIALAAGLAYSRQKRSLPLMLETLGALAYFLLAIASWFLFKLLYWTSAAPSVFSAVGYVFDFLDVVALLMFAAGFCWEKAQQWRTAPAPAAQVIAKRVG